MMRPMIGVTAFTSEGRFGTTASTIGQDYINAILAAGGTPVGIPVGLDDESRHQILEVIDGLLLPGGVDIAPTHFGEEPHPQLGPVDSERDTLELPLARSALQSGLPLLGICRGIQVMAVAGGGTLYQDLSAQLGEVLDHVVLDQGKDHLVHVVDVEPDSKLGVATGQNVLRVNSRHHQAVKDLPPGFVITARAPDGVIEGMENPAHPYAVGIQCHPENLWSSTAPAFAGLFRSFVQAAARHVGEHRTE